MTTDMHDVRSACEADPQCTHKICHECKRPIITTRQRRKDHPGAAIGVLRDLLCDRCKIIYGRNPYTPPQPEPEPDPLAEDQRFVLLSDEDMDRIEHEYPSLHTWHMWRRRERFKTQDTA